MDIAYLHLYVKDALSWRDWFVEKLSFWPVDIELRGHWGELAVQSAQILLLISSQRTGKPEVEAFLRDYAEGVADVAFWVRDLSAIAARVERAGGQLTCPIQQQGTAAAALRWCRIQGWGSVSHTLIQRRDLPQNSLGRELSRPELSGAELLGSELPGPIGSAVDSQGQGERPINEYQGSGLPWLGIDHAVLNVSSGQLLQAVNWYEVHLGFIRQQQFAISTASSGLRSFVLKHPEGNATIPINEPTSQNSQIQEFLDWHRGAGVQHVALQTKELVKTVATLRQREVAFLPVPPTYYQQLRERPGFWDEAGDWEAIAQQQILVDWPREDPQTRLLQTFTHPLFEQPTFFLELIERQSRATAIGIKRAEGFGEGNFQALFEAIEREQEQRGAL